MLVHDLSAPQFPLFTAHSLMSVGVSIGNVDRQQLEQLCTSTTSPID